MVPHRALRLAGRVVGRHALHLGGAGPVAGLGLRDRVELDFGASDRGVTSGLVAGRLGGVVTYDPPLLRGRVEPDFLDPRVVVAVVAHSNCRLLELLAEAVKAERLSSGPVVWPNQE